MTIRDISRKLITAGFAATLATPLLLAGCQKPCSEGGPCISPEGARILMQGFAGMQYRPAPVNYDPSLYVPPAPAQVRVVP